MRFKNIFIASSGGQLEMYDFTIYAFFAPILSQLFFPKSVGAFVALLSTFAVFASGYLSRAVGAAIFGHFGDRYGRKSTLLWTIILMAFSTSMVGLLPTWQQVGVLAPILLLLLRLLQGIAVGGDLPGAITFVAEHADPQYRGQDCSWILFGVNIGLLMTIFIGGVITASMIPAHLMLWGWRLVFLSGIVIGGIAFYLRFHLLEPSVFKQFIDDQAALRQPLKNVLQQHAFVLLKAVFIMMIISIIAGQLLYFPTYFHKVLGLSYKQAIFDNVSLIILFSLMIPVFGYLSDTVGRRAVFAFGTLGFAFFSIPIFFGFQMPNSHFFDLAIVLIALLSAACIGTFPSLLAELFPTQVRYSGLALGYNISFALFCGTTPIIMMAFIHYFSSPIAPGIYLALGATLSFLAMLFVEESKGVDLCQRMLST